MSDKKTNLFTKLMHIQQELKAPKNQKSSFGNYNYRSAEDILEAVKPLLKKYKCIINISDNVKNIGQFNYINAIATLYDTESSDAIEVSGYAREAQVKKGMDDSQITGATSSYARKYALNGLFAIDDTKDADSTNTHGKTDKKEDSPRYGEPDRKSKFDVIKDTIEAADSLEKLKAIKKRMDEVEFVTDKQSKYFYAMWKNKEKTFL